jgi:hypothetical protein
VNEKQTVQTLQFFYYWYHKLKTNYGRIFGTNQKSKQV